MVDPVEDMLARRVWNILVTWDPSSKTDYFYSTEFNQVIEDKEQTEHPDPRWRLLGW